MQKHCTKSNKAKLIRHTFSVFISIMLACATFISVYAESFLIINGFSFLCNSSDEAVIYSYDERETEVVIPKTIIGSRVVGIAEYAFMRNTSMTSISFNESIYLKKIGISAFANCTNLKSVELNDSIESIATSAFHGCTNLEEIQFNRCKLTEIPDYAFSNCSSLKRIKIPDGVTKIGAYAFDNCTELTTVFIPDSVTEIDLNAFANTSQVIIVSSTDSYANTYATENNISFLSKDLFCIGDVNRDGNINILDATQIQKYLAHIVDLAEPALTNADTDLNCKINILDATEIQKFLAKLPSHFDEIEN